MMMRRGVVVDCMCRNIDLIWEFGSFLIVSFWLFERERESVMILMVYRVFMLLGVVLLLIMYIHIHM